MTLHHTFPPQISQGLIAMSQEVDCPAALNSVTRRLNTRQNERFTQSQKLTFFSDLTLSQDTEMQDLNFQL